MTKEDLKDGDLLIDRRGVEYIYFEHTKMIHSITKNSESYKISGYTDDLIEYSFGSNDPSFDIIEVKRSLLKNVTTYRGTIWKRDEVTEMTIKEIEEKLGITNLKIVK